MRRFAAGLVLLVLPFSGVRVICVETATDPASTTEVISTPATDDCARLCALPHRLAASGSEPGSGSQCALSTNPSCFDMFGNIAVAQAPQSFHIAPVTAPFVEHAAALYLEPSLSQPGPPPKL